MGPLRVESINQEQEVVDFIDLRGDVNAERLVLARRILKAKQAAALGDITLADTVHIDLRVRPIEIGS